MLGRLPSLIAVRLLAALLLATIGLQAGQSFEMAPRPSHGSAFSAATAEVALAPQRRDEEGRIVVAPLPAVPPRLMAMAARAVPTLAATPAPRPQSTGPPAREILARQPAPRAPPILS